MEEGTIYDGLETSNQTTASEHRWLKEHGVTVSESVVQQLLLSHGFGRRKAQKREATGTSASRNEQFRRNREHKTEYLDRPIRC